MADDLSRNFRMNFQLPVHCKYILFTCVPLFTDIQLYCLHLIPAPSTVKNWNTYLQWFTVTSTLLHCNVYGKYLCIFYTSLFMGVPASKVYICSLCEVSKDAYDYDSWFYNIFWMKEYQKVKLPTLETLLLRLLYCSKQQKD